MKLSTDTKDTIGVFLYTVGIYMFLFTLYWLAFEDHKSYLDALTTLGGKGKFGYFMFHRLMLVIIVYGIVTIACSLHKDYHRGRTNK